MAALISPFVILFAAAFVSVLQFWRTRTLHFDSATLYFPDPRKPGEYVLLVAIYALPAAWLMMVLAVPVFLLALHRRAVSWRLASAVGAFVGLVVSTIVGAPRYAWLLPEGIVYGGLVGGTFWCVERFVWLRLGRAASKDNVENA